MPDELRAPLVPPDVDLRDFPYLPLDIARLFGSEFHALSNDAEWRAGMSLWLKSYHQVPAASLPDDDVALARLAEHGRNVKAWKKVRTAALRGWMKCSDGLLYHPVVAEKALDAWIVKLHQRKSSAAGNAKRHGGAFDPGPFDTAIAESISRSQLRRAKVVFRGQIRGLKLGSEGVTALMQFITDAFWDAMNHLWWDRLRAMGRDPSEEATAELLAERKPWPTCFVLSDEAILSWLDLIERTGGKLAPDTRMGLLKARTDLQAGRMLDGATEALVDRLIRARWRQGHEMPWVSKWDAVWAASA